MLKFLRKIDDLAEVFVRGIMNNNGYVLLVLLILGISTYHHKSSDNLLIGRSWCDVEISSTKDPFCIYSFHEHEDEISAAYYSGNLDKYTVERFDVKVGATKLEMTWPGTGVVNITRYSVSRDKHGGYDLKLIIESDPRHGGKMYVYYGNEEG